MKNTIKNHLLLIFLYLNSLLSSLKIRLGLLQVKYGITGYFSAQGVNFSTCIHNKEKLEACQKYDKFRPDDVIVVTYPKAGTHFTMEIIWSILKEKGLVDKATTFALEAAPPAFTLNPLSIFKAKKGLMADLDAVSSPRVIATHLPWDMLPQQVKDGKVKVVHCMRNPKDVVCSYFPFLSKVRVLQPGTQWKDFFMSFIEGNVLYGSYANYLKKWYPSRNMASVLNLQFEEMKMDLEGNVRRITEFLGVELTEDQIRRVTVANTFENKKKEMGKGHVIYRTGKSGGWKSDLSVEQNEIMDEWIEAEMKGMKDLKLKYE